MTKNDQNQDPRRVRIALRVSTTDQGEDGNGIQSQLDACESYAREHGMEIVGVYRDVISGTSHPRDREGLSRLMRDLKEGETVLVHRRDRLSRDMYLGLWCEKEIQRLGGTLESTDGGNGNDPTQELFRHLVMIFAQYEKSLIRDRTRSALKKIKDSGRKLGRPPFGFSYTESGDLVKNDHYPTVERMQNLRDEGLNYSKISRTLNAEDLKSQTGKDFTPQMVRNLLFRMDQDSATLQEVA